MELNLLAIAASGLCYSYCNVTSNTNIHLPLDSNFKTILITQTTSRPVIPKIKVMAVQVTGSTLLSQSQVNKIVAPFLNKTLQFEDLLKIRTAITDEYVRKGYITSGAYLPPQDVSKGVVKVQAIEGEIEKIEIRRLHRLRESYARSRITKGMGKPFNRYRLEAALQMLQKDPLFKSVSAELTAGTKLGSNILILNLQEAPAVSSALIIDNQESPSVGSFGATAIAGYNNLLGIGDRLSAEYGITEGIRSYNFGLELPINASDGKLRFRYGRGRSTVVAQPFAPLDITGRVETYALGYTQPIVRTPNTEFSLSLSGELRRSRTFLYGDEPFSFTTGPEKGESKVSVLRFSQDWVNRTTNTVLAARSQFSLGIDAFDATINNTGTDGRFFSWLGQFQWLQALNEQGDAVFAFRTAAQLTGDSLLPLEQLSISGSDTVRGYRNDAVVGDNGVVASLELRLPIVGDSGGWGLVQIVPFIDAGTSWSNKEADDTNSTLLSTGLGLRWQLSDRASLQVDWGIPLIDVGSESSGLQFSLQFQPF